MAPGPAQPLARRRADMETQRATGSTAHACSGLAGRLRRCPASRTPDVAPPIAALRGAGRTFDDVVALTGVDLAIARGSIVGVIGPSGAGKTTAIRLLTGALRPTSGEAEVLGGDPTRLPAETRDQDRLHAPARLAVRRPDRRREPGLRRQPVRTVPVPAAAHASGRCSTGWSSATRASGGPATCRAACAAGCSSRARSSTTPSWCSSTSRPPASTRSSARASGASCHRLREAGRTLRRSPPSTCPRPRSATWSR